MPEKLWMSHPCRCSRSYWLGLWATWGWHPCQCQRGLKLNGLYDPFQHKQWYDSMIYEIVFKIFFILILSYWNLLERFLFFMHQNALDNLIQFLSKNPLLCITILGRDWLGSIITAADEDIDIKEILALTLLLQLSDFFEPLCQYFRLSTLYVYMY